MNCERCGAVVDGAALACPYCHLTTPAGVLAQRNQEAADRARAQWVQAVDFQKQRAIEMQIASTATQSVWLSAAGMLVCGCFPLGIVGIIQAMRAKSMAAAQKMAPPPRAQIGFILGIVSVLVSSGICVAAFISSSHDQARANARIADIDKQVGNKASNATLDRGTACLLAEEAALKTGFDGNEGYSLEKFDCPGRLVPAGDTAQLEDFAFMWSSTNYKVNVCFKHGAKWFVETLSEDACDLGVVGADAGPTAATAAAAPTTSSTSQHRTKHVPHAAGSSSR
jgi:hypothetical protein